MKKHVFNYCMPKEIYKEMKKNANEIDYNCNEILDALLFYFFNLSDLEKHQLIFNYKSSNYFKEVNK